MSIWSRTHCWMRPVSLATVVSLCSLSAMSSSVLADGGVVRAAQVIGDRTITVFTSPTPLTAGPADVSVLIQDRETNKVVDDATVTVRLIRVGRSGAGVVYPATREAATNKLFYSAIFDLPVAGDWRFEIAVAEAPSPGPASQEPQLVAFAASVAAPPPRWTQMWIWIFLPAPIIAVYVINEILKERRAAGNRSRDAN